MHLIVLNRNHMLRQPSLLFCIIMDVLGCATYLLPGIGEWFDVAFAPISAVIYFFAFRGMRGIIGGSINFIEELLPGTDIIPTFTITWFLVNRSQKDHQNETLKG